MEALKGTGVALVTPFTDKQSVDYAALENLVDHVIEGGVDYIVVLGTTAETATMDGEERKKVADTIIRRNAGRVPLVIGIGGNNTAGVIAEFSVYDMNAFCAVLSVVPYYNKPNQEGIYRHFAEIARQSPLPVILYNVPGRTGVNMSNETTLRLAREFKNIVAIKEASGCFDQITKLIMRAPEGFMVISGDDSLALPLVYFGASGVISVLANSHPKECSQMVSYGLAGDIAKANALHFRVLNLIGMLFEEGNPVGVKAALCNLGMCGGALRLPLCEASDSLRDKIRVEMASVAACRQTGK